MVKIIEVSLRVELFFAVNGLGKYDKALRLTPNSSCRGEILILFTTVLTKTFFLADQKIAFLWGFQFYQFQHHDW